MRNYNDPEYKKWRQKIYARDRHTCQWPGCKNKRPIQAHHILKWSEYPGLRYHTNNGISLCKNHHQQIKNNEDSYIQLFTNIIMNKNEKR